MSVVATVLIILGLFLIVVAMPKLISVVRKIVWCKNHYGDVVYVSDHGRSWVQATLIKFTGRYFLTRVQDKRDRDDFELFWGTFCFEYQLEGEHRLPSGWQNPYDSTS